MAIEHLFSLHTGYIDFTGYLRYLDSIQARMPVHVYEFASDPAHHDLNARSSLHDAWLQSLTIGETAEGSRQEMRQTEVRLCLLGPYHDRRIHLHYTAVEAYAFQSPARHGEPRYSHTAHGDLLAHAIWINPAGMLVHDMVFERGSTLRIECADIRHAQEPLQ
ncbi:hypothetical protein [Acidovorax sp. Leaf78]|uniref:hypothetical protein n=1 Tax=unclassified Acidovorax TaxID=2684926 RepID=UPI0006F75E3F|nr:hypothetical protein [Acidovorax sp. Leaf78]KQO23101.1 hypothetical protein ASF16_24435 [Acidovorax sp. Leaf78]